MTLEQVQKYCKGKRIIIVGNSSRILQSNQGRFIDGHDVVVRINGACPIKQRYRAHTGGKVNIHVISYVRRERALTATRINGAHINLRLNPSQEFNCNNCYFGPKSDYDEICKQFTGCQPSSGALAIAFFKKHIDYKSLTLLGFDFFEADPTIRSNEFGTFLYKSHSPVQERKFIEGCIDDNVKLVKI